MAVVVLALSGITTFLSYNRHLQTHSFIEIARFLDFSRSAMVCSNGTVDTVTNVTQGWVVNVTRLQPCCHCPDSISMEHRHKKELVIPGLIPCS